MKSKTVSVLIVSVVLAGLGSSCKKPGGGSKGSAGNGAGGASEPGSGTPGNWGSCGPPLDSWLYTYCTSNGISQVTGGSGKILVPTYDGPSISYDEGCYFYNYRTVPVGQTRAMHIDSKGVIYAGTRKKAAIGIAPRGGQGLGISYDSGQTYEMSEGADELSPQAINVDGAGNIFFGTYDGQGLGLSFDRGKNVVLKSGGLSGLPSNIIRRVVFDDGVIYAATQSGIAISRNAGYSFDEVLTLEVNRLASNSIYDLVIRDGIIYAATYNGLSVSFDGGRSFERRSTAQGLGSNNVNGLHVDGNGRVYVGTSLGLSISNERSAVNFRNQTYENGLGSRSMGKPWVSDDGTLYVPHGMGLGISKDGGENFIVRNTGMGIGGLVQPSNPAPSPEFIDPQYTVSEGWPSITAVSNSQKIIEVDDTDDKELIIDVEINEGQHHNINFIWTFVRDKTEKLLSKSKQTPDLLRHLAKLDLVKSEKFQVVLRAFKDDGKYVARVWSINYNRSAIFVDPINGIAPELGDKRNLGTRLLPYLTLNNGLYQAKRLGFTDVRLAHGEFPESSLTIRDNFRIRGGYDPTNHWLRMMTPEFQTVIKTKAAGIFLRGIESKFTFSGLKFESRSPEESASTSYALRIENCSNVVIEHSAIFSAPGTDGLDGEDGADGQHGVLGNQGDDSDFAAARGALGAYGYCQNSGGFGGFGGRPTLTGANGQTLSFSTIEGDVSIPGGEGGDGSNRGGTPALVGATGVNGVAGTNGMEGFAGVVGGAVSHIDWLPIHGTDGTNGTQGSGAGGGGGGGGYQGTPWVYGPLTEPFGGAGGGSGGSGGCFGKYGKGAESGGGSIAVIAYQSTVRIHDTIIVPSTGGKGGRGGKGGSGGNGGLGGEGGQAQDLAGNGGPGGIGGSGGDGGRGGDGVDGPSVQILETESVVTRE